MKKRMRLSPKNKVKLSVRNRLIAIASVFFIAATVTVLYFVFDSNKEIIALPEQNFTDRFGFYRSIEAADFVVNEESDLYHIPFTVILEHNDFKSKNFGGRLFDASARDLIFTRNGQKIPLKSQIESYDATHGFIHATVWIDTLRKSEKPNFDVYYALAGSILNPPFFSSPGNLLISMNEGLTGFRGLERLSANASGTFKANGLMGNGRGFSNERGDYVQYNLTNNRVFQDGFTLSTWVFPELKNQSQIICGYSDLTGTDLYIGINKQNVLFIQLKNQEAEVLVSGLDEKLTFNQWSHLALACDPQNKTIKLYLNGSEILHDETHSIIGSPAALFFGRSRQNASDGFTGIVDQIELIGDIKNKDWCTFTFNNAINPCAQWTYGSAETNKPDKRQLDATRTTLNEKVNTANAITESKFQIQKKRESISENASTVSSSATLMQQKLQAIQQKVREAELAKN